MKGIMLLSLLCGAFFGICTFVVFLILMGIGEPMSITAFALPMSLLAGAGFALLISVWLIIETKFIMNKKYSVYEKEIKSEIFYKSNGNFQFKKKVRNGNVYFCEEGIVIISIDRKPIVVEKIVLSDIRDINFGELHIDITAKDGREFFVMITDAKGISDKLREKNWIV